MSDCNCMKIKTPAFVQMPSFLAIAINENGELIVKVDDKRSFAKLNGNGELEVKGI